MKNIQMNKDYRTAGGDKVRIMSLGTDDFGRTIYYGVRVIEEDHISVESYTETGSHHWNCDLDITSEEPPTTLDRPWHMP